MQEVRLWSVFQFGCSSFPVFLLLKFDFCRSKQQAITMAAQSQTQLSVGNTLNTHTAYTLRGTCFQTCLFAPENATHCNGGRTKKTGKTFNDDDTDVRCFLGHCCNPTVRSAGNVSWFYVFFALSLSLPHPTPVFPPWQSTKHHARPVQPLGGWCENGKKAHEHRSSPPACFLCAVRGMAPTISRAHQAACTKQGKRVPSPHECGERKKLPNRRTDFSSPARSIARSKTMQNVLRLRVVVRECGVSPWSFLGEAPCAPVG